MAKKVKTLRASVNRKLKFGRGATSNYKINKKLAVGSGSVLEGLLQHLFEEVCENTPDTRLTSQHVVKTIRENDNLRELVKDFKFVLVNETD